MAKGTVKWFNTEKGYGFIQPSDGGKDIFVHITAVQAAGLQSLQDNLLKDTAMDVSAEISALETVLAQEGLTKDELLGR